MHTLVRDLQKKRPPRKRAGVGRQREVPFQRVEAWAESQPGSRWERSTVRDAEKGRLEVDAMTVPVKAKQEGRVGPEERRVVMRNVGASEIDYAFTNADASVPLVEVVRAQRQRHRIEAFVGAGKGDAGLGHYEVRSWVGWHHHMTLAMVAMWFLSPERRRVGGGKTPAVTVPQVRQIVTRLLRSPTPTAEQIAGAVTRVLRRNEEARIYHWHKATRTFPPRRSHSDTG